MRNVKDALLGFGHFGKVYYGTVRCNITNRLLPVAVKVAKLTNTSSNDESLNEAIALQIEAMQSELNVLAYIQRLDGPVHPNIIRLIGTTTTIENQFCLIMEYCEYGSLDKYLQRIYKNGHFINEIVYNAAKLEIETFQMV